MLHKKKIIKPKILIKRFKMMMLKHLKIIVIEAVQAVTALCQVSNKKK